MRLDFAVNVMRFAEDCCCKIVELNFDEFDSAAGGILRSLSMLSLAIGCIT